MERIHFAWSLALVFTLVMTSVPAETVHHRLVAVDSGNTWVSAFWGYNAPKLAHDGNHFYSVGFWGATFEESVGTIYKITDGTVERGRNLTAVMQPPMVMLDSHKRLVVACAQVGKPPLLLHATEPGNVKDFEEIALPAEVTSARYMGAGIHDDTLVMGFLQGDQSDFLFLVCDLGTQEWREPVVLQEGHVGTVPHTAWVYPIIVPSAEGVHMLVTNADTGFSYNKVMYLFTPYDPVLPVEAELLAEVPPGGEKILFGQSMWISEDGTVNAAALYQPAHTLGLYAFRRDPVTKAWADTFIRRTPVGLKPGDEDFVRTGIVKAGNATLGGIGSLFEDRMGRLWLTATAGDRLELFRSDDQGRTWLPTDVSSFEEHDLRYTYFMHGIHPGSGSTLPEGPHCVFSTTIQDGYKLWLAAFETATLDHQ